MAIRFFCDRAPLFRKRIKGAPIVDILAPQPRDYCVLKPKHSGFFATALATLLEYIGVERLVLTGVATHQCVLFTANDAYVRDFKLHIPWIARGQDRRAKSPGSSVSQDRLARGHVRFEDGGIQSPKQTVQESKLTGTLRRRHSLAEAQVEVPEPNLPDGKRRRVGMLGVRRILVSSGTTIEGTCATRLSPDCAHCVPQSSDTSPGGSASHPMPAAGSKRTANFHCTIGMMICTR